MTDPTPTSLDLDAITTDESAADVPALAAAVRAWNHTMRQRDDALAAPVWDEDTVAVLVQAIERVIGEWERESPQIWAEVHTRVDEAIGAAKFAILRDLRDLRDLRPILAVVREHGPVKPDREIVARAMHREDYEHVDGELYHGTPEDADAEVEPYRRYADAALALWPGQSRAEVEAEALRKAAEEIEAARVAVARGTRAFPGSSLEAYADAARLAAKGGTDHG